MPACTNAHPCVCEHAYEVLSAGNTAQGSTGRPTDRPLWFLSYVVSSFSLARREDSAGGKQRTVALLSHKHPIKLKLTLFVRGFSFYTYYVYV